MTKTGSTFVALVSFCSVFFSHNLVTGLRSRLRAAVVARQAAVVAGRPEALNRQAAAMARQGGRRPEMAYRRVEVGGQ
jgi:hypothetical protein